MKVIRRVLSNLRPRFRRDYLSVGVKCDRSVRIFHPEYLHLGQYIYIGPNCVLNAQGKIRVGDGTIFGPEVVVLSSNHDFRIGNLLPYDIYEIERPVFIGAGVWIGYRALIGAGVHIGDGAVVAMGAVVTKDVAPGHVVGGNPARIMSERDPEIIARGVYDKAYFHKLYWSGTRPRELSPRS